VKRCSTGRIFQTNKRVERVSGRLKVNPAIAIRYGQWASRFRRVAHLAIAAYRFKLPTPPRRQRPRFPAYSSSKSAPYPIASTDLAGCKPAMATGLARRVTSLLQIAC